MKRKLKILIPFIPIISFLIAYIVPIIIFAKSGINGFIILAILVGSTLVSIFLAVVLHEAGHLLFGLLTGYKMSMFRVGNFVWYKNNDEKIAFRFEKFFVPALGQCVMSPPKYKKDKKINFYLYNSGGLIVTYTLVLIGLLGLILIHNYYIKYGFIALFAVNLYFALNNSIVVEYGFNDASNSYLVYKDRGYLLNILYTLEMSRNIMLNRRYKARTTYPVYIAKRLDHVTFPALLFKFYQLIDRNEIEASKKYIQAIRAGYYSIFLLQHKAMALVEICYADIVVEKNYLALRNNLRLMDDKIIDFIKKTDDNVALEVEMLQRIGRLDFKIDDLIEQVRLNNINDLEDSEYQCFYTRMLLLRDSLTGLYGVPQNKGEE